MLETSPGKFGRYEVIAELGTGAMGVVYRAHDPVIGRDVAVKTIKRTLDLPAPKREEYLERFSREAQAAGKLSDHPHIVPVFDVGREGELPYIVMAFVEGESLDRARRRNNFDEADLDALAKDMCAALGHAHRNGTIHRDVKPANILMTKRGAMLTDFGIARLDGSELTRVGTFLGSPSYMSPEQVRGGELSGASDMFSLAVILYMLLTGEKPFRGDDTNEILYKIVHDKHPAPSQNDAALAKWDAFFERALAKESAQRFADAEAFYFEFAAVLHEAGTGTVSASTGAGSPKFAAAAPAPRPPAKPLPPLKEPRVNPLADRSMFHGVDMKHHIPSRRTSSTDTGRLDRLLKAGGGPRRRSQDGGLPPAVWAVLVVVVLTLGVLIYALWPAPAPTPETPAAAAPLGGKKGTNR